VLHHEATFRPTDLPLASRAERVAAEILSWWRAPRSGHRLLVRHRLWQGAAAAGGTGGAGSARGVLLHGAVQTPDGPLPIPGHRAATDATVSELQEVNPLRSRLVIAPPSAQPLGVDENASRAPQNGLLSGWDGRTLGARARRGLRARLHPQRSRRLERPAAQRARFRRPPRCIVTHGQNSDGLRPLSARTGKGSHAEPCRGALKRKRSGRRQGCLLASNHWAESKSFSKSLFLRRTAPALSKGWSLPKGQR